MNFAKNRNDPSVLGSNLLFLKSLNYPVDTSPSTNYVEPKRNFRITGISSDVMFNLSKSDYQVEKEFQCTFNGMDIEFLAAYNISNPVYVYKNSTPFSGGSSNPAHNADEIPVYVSVLIIKTSNTLRTSVPHNIEKFSDIVNLLDVLSSKFENGPFERKRMFNSAAVIDSITKFLTNFKYNFKLPNPVAAMSIADINRLFKYNRTDELAELNSRETILYEQFRRTVSTLSKLSEIDDCVFTNYPSIKFTNHTKSKFGKPITIDSYNSLYQKFENYDFSFILEKYDEMYNKINSVLVEFPLFCPNSTDDISWLRFLDIASTSSNEFKATLSNCEFTSEFRINSTVPISDLKKLKTHLVDLIFKTLINRDTTELYAVIDNINYNTSRKISRIGQNHRPTCLKFGYSSKTPTAISLRYLSLNNVKDGLLKSVAKIDRSIFKINDPYIKDVFIQSGSVFVELKKPIRIENFYYDTLARILDQDEDTVFNINYDLLRENNVEIVYSPINYLRLSVFSTGSARIDSLYTRVLGHNGSTESVIATHPNMSGNAICFGSIEPGNIEDFVIYYKTANFSSAYRSSLLVPINKTASASEITKVKKLDIVAATKSSYVSEYLEDDEFFDFYTNAFPPITRHLK
jgi:hypothetical protein